MDFISGDKFWEIADYTFFPQGINDFNVIPNTFITDNLKEGKIIVYCHTHHVSFLFDYIVKNQIKNEIYLITHNSDWPVDQNIFLSKPNNIKKWFTQNVNFPHKDLISIPIGLENKRWFVDIKKKEKMLDKIKEEKNIINLVYVNHNINNFPSERIIPYQRLNGTNFATLVNGKNGENFDDYLNNIYNHKFVVSPRGVGIDTHRLWECLYLGTIPIEKRNFNNIQFNDLPICFVNDWSEINEEFLKTQYDKIKNKVWNMDKLNFSYWKEKILSL